MATIWSRQRTPPSENGGLYLPVPRMDIDGVRARRSCLTGEATFHVTPGRRSSLSEGIQPRFSRHAAISKDPESVQSTLAKTVIIDGPRLARRPFLVPPPSFPRVAARSERTAPSHGGISAGNVGYECARE